MLILFSEQLLLFLQSPPLYETFILSKHALECSPDRLKRPVKLNFICYLLYLFYNDVH